MGLSIQGVRLKKVILNCKNDESSEDWFSKTFVYPEFFRTLSRSEEITYHQDEVDCVHIGISMSYCWYSEFRENFSKLMVGKSHYQILKQCAKLKKKDKYPNPLYHILNFADNEGYIGPKALKEMADHLTPENIPSNLDEDSKQLIDCILETSTFKDGYLKFS